MASRATCHRPGALRHELRVVLQELARHLLFLMLALFWDDSGTPLRVLYCGSGPRQPTADLVCGRMFVGASAKGVNKLPVPGNLFPHSPEYGLLYWLQPAAAKDGSRGARWSADSYFAACCAAAGWLGGYAGWLGGYGPSQPYPPSQPRRSRKPPPWTSRGGRAAFSPV